MQLHECSGTCGGRAYIPALVELGVSGGICRIFAPSSGSWQRCSECTEAFLDSVQDPNEDCISIVQPGGDEGLDEYLLHFS